MSIQTAIESISAQCRDAMQAKHNVLNGMRSVLDAVLNGEAEDEHDILQNFDAYLNALDRLYGNKNKIHVVESKLSHLRQNGNIADYILQFQTLSSQVRWNEAALVARLRLKKNFQLQSTLALAVEPGTSLGYCGRIIQGHGTFC
ncbi:hypothetical protein BGZ65_002236 [Modicella reniformis]|uniref:Retrotransposon gag domain-containing protein n=1 Tax=Modicella reniformis TaxID=1440133 RepID=A0A9P6MIX9_9FUNG|nr:hypothetical protein BGZ65_002236 [Modicella reniformis]